MDGAKAVKPVAETVRPEAAPSIARAEISLFSSVLAIRERHGLERLGIAFWDAETTLQWAYNADDPFHAASTMKVAVLLGVYRQVSRGELTLDASDYGSRAQLPGLVLTRNTQPVEGRPELLEVTVRAAWQSLGAARPHERERQIELPTRVEVRR